MEMVEIELQWETQSRPNSSLSDSNDFFGTGAVFLHYIRFRWIEVTWYAMLCINYFQKLILCRIL